MTGWRWCASSPPDWYPRWHKTGARYVGDDPGKTAVRKYLPHDMTDNVNTDGFSKLQRLKELRVAHRDLDAAIAALARHVEVDQLHVRRLKKEKLRLKDIIARLESALIPDLNA